MRWGIGMQYLHNASFLAGQLRKYFVRQNADVDGIAKILTQFIFLNVDFDVDSLSPAVFL